MTFVDKLPFYSIAVLFLVSMLVTWPGILRPDSMGQYGQAISGTFGDHHPPMMGLYWRLLSYIYPGSGLMLMTHMMLFWASVFVFSWSFRKTAIAWVFIVIAILPQVICYLPFILKDISFMCAFLLVAAMLSYYSVVGKQPKSLATIGMLVLMFYGLSVKYQAIFVLPCLVAWFCYVRNGFRWQTKIFYYSALMYALLLASLQLFHSIVVTNPSHSWQYVKLYDLAAISIHKDQPVFPDFIIKNPSFSMDAVKAKFNSKRVDELAFMDDAPLQKSNEKVHRQELWYFWLNKIWENPKVYFAHRVALFNNLINNTPFKSLSEVASHKGKEQVPESISQGINWLEQYHILPFLKKISTFGYFIPLLVFYLIFALVKINSNKFAVPLLGLSSMGLTLVGSLFVFSMASDPRYIYLATCCLNFAHPFFYMTIVSGTTRSLQRLST